MYADELLKKIKALREKMITIGMSTSFNDERVIQLSEQLDKLIVKYQRMLLSTKRKSRSVS